MIEPRDVVIAILGSAAALAGFVLVFLGIIIASYQSYPGGVPEAVVRPTGSPAQRSCSRSSWASSTSR